jgi:hypothetical protein
MSDMKTITLRLTPADYSKINAYAKGKRMSMSALLLSLFDAELSQGVPIKGRTKRDIVVEEYEAHVLEIPMFTSQAEAKAYMDAIHDMRKRAGLEGELGIQQMPMPAQVVAQFNSFYATKTAASEETQESIDASLMALIKA